MGMLFKIPATPSYWISTFGGPSYDYGVSVAPSNDGVYVIVNNFDDGSALVKYSPTGSIAWQRRLGGTSTYMRHVCTHTDGSVYVVGQTVEQGAGGGDLLVVKYTALGSVVWQRAIGGISSDDGIGIDVDAAGDVYVSGTTFSAGAGNADTYVAKISNAGDVLWQRVIGGASTDSGGHVAVGTDASIYVTMRTASQGAGSFDAALIKYGTLGDIVWQRALGGVGSESAGQVVVDASGGVYVVGSTASQGAGSNDLLVAKYDSSGTVLWQKALGGLTDDNAVSVTTDTNNNVYVVGYFDSGGSGDYDTVIVKLSSSGSVVWQRAFGGLYGEYGYGVAIGPQGELYVVGETDPVGDYTNDVLVVKLPSDGSKTGTYGYFTYQATTLTETTTTLTETTTTLTGSTPSLTQTTTTLTETSPSYVAVTTNI